MKWEPISKDELIAKIKTAETLMMELNQRYPKFWNAIEIEPEKWSLNPWGTEGGGFWVVGIIGKQCIYYNDIEDGFNVSTFKEWGKICEYWCNQDELQHTIHFLMRVIEN